MSLPRRTPMPRQSTPMAQMSAKRLVRLAAEGLLFPSSTLARAREPKDAPKRKRPTDTGPARSVSVLLHRRSGRVCEWPLCNNRATDRHHRLNRKNGGRHGAMRRLLNGVAWLLHCCRFHHAYVTSPYGERRARALAMGWLLLEGQDATLVPVWTRHDPEPVWLDDLGRWHRYEEGAA